MDRPAQAPSPRSWRRLLLNLYLPRPWPLTLLLLLQAAIIAREWAAGSGSRAGPLSRLFEIELVSALSGLATIQAVQAALRGGRWSRAAANGLLAIGLALLLAYNFRAQHPVDYWLVRDNLRELFHAPTLRSLASQLGWPLGLLLLGFPVTLALLERRSGTLSGVRPEPFPMAALVAAVVVASVGFRLHRLNKDQVTRLIMSGYSHQRDGFSLPAGLASVPYPFVREPAGATVVAPSQLPHVFLIFLESFNAGFLGRRSPEGVAYTPFLDALKERGLFAERFYGNSIQTDKGQVATLCSILPTAFGKVMTDFTDVRLRCLPQIMREAGYRTVYFQAYPDLSFDKTGAFMERNGFSMVRAATGELLEPADMPHVWGWGLQDDAFYRKAFRVLEAPEQRSDAPLFVVLSTIMNHWPFDKIPRDLRLLYPEPAGPREWYANSIHLADQQLKTFFDELARRPAFKDSLVLVIGDHSFPAGEHGNFLNDVGSGEENFRTLFLALWPGRLAPHRTADDEPHSQLDVAPTVLDLLGITSPNHFLGRSMAGSAPKTSRALQMIQPYDGKHLVCLIYPYKYVKNLRTKTESVFDLAADPSEEHDILEVVARNDPALLEQLRAELAVIYLNQKLVEEDRIWPRR